MQVLEIQTQVLKLAEQQQSYLWITSPTPNIVLSNAVLDSGVCPEKAEANPAPEAQLSLGSKGKRPRACFLPFPFPLLSTLSRGQQTRTMKR